jgi:hypothetical protein
LIGILTVQELTTFPKPNFSSEVKDLLAKASGNGNGTPNMDKSDKSDNSVFPGTENPSLNGSHTKKPVQNLRKGSIIGARYPSPLDVNSRKTLRPSG